MAPQRQISPERKTIYYVGMVSMALGLLFCFGVMISSSLHIGDFSNFNEQARSAGVGFLTGMALFGGGGVMMMIGRMGVAGSGVKLDPEEARRDVEPWARMTGGVVKDAMDEAGIKIGGQAAGDNQNLPFDERLRRLQKLRDDGLINEQEFEATKKKILENA